MGRLAQELHEVQRTHQVTLPVSVQVGYLAASYRWASGEKDWAGLVRDAYGGHEGDLIRAFRRLIDLCRQLAESPEVEASLRDQLWQHRLRARSRHRLRECVDLAQAQCLKPEPVSPPR